MKLIVLILLLLGVIFNDANSQDIEYYPSQSMIVSRKFPKNIKVTKCIGKQQPIPYYYAENKSNETHNEKSANNRYYFNESPIKKINDHKKRAVDPVFHGHPKTREELWNEHFLGKSTTFDQTPSLIKLIHTITLKYLNDCTPVLLYDSMVLKQENLMFQNLLKDFPVTFVHGNIEDSNSLKNPDILRPVRECVHFIVFITDLNTCSKILGMQSTSKVVIVARTSQWAVQEFLAGSLSRKFVNLLVIGQSFVDDDDSLVCIKSRIRIKLKR